VGKGRREDNGGLHWEVVIFWIYFEGKAELMDWTWSVRSQGWLQYFCLEQL
jgi:hypothetical protein